MDIAFSARLSNIMSFASGISKVNVTADVTTVQDEAKELERLIYCQATTKEEYEAACVRQVNSLRPRTISVATKSNDEAGDGIDPNGPDLGPYKKATFHRNGLFSTILKAISENPVEEKSGSLSNLVALKVTTPSAMTPPHDSEREARILRQFRCQQIVRLVSTLWQPNGRLVLVFPFMPIDLETLIKTSSFPQSLAPEISRDLFSALSYIHAFGIIHRDLKPSNVLLRSTTGPACLADFGIAWSPTDPASEPAQQKITEVGTAQYRPPEVLFGCTSYDTSLDLWAAGCTIAEMVQPSHRSVFDAGDLGSELALIQSIFSTLGTPNEELWPSVKHLPDWGKVRFVEYPAKPWFVILEEASSPAADLISNLVKYEGSWRMSATQALNHPFFMNF